MLHRMLNAIHAALATTNTVQSVGLSVTRLRCAKTTERIEFLFGTQATLHLMGVPIRDGEGVDAAFDKLLLFSVSYSYHITV